ncbi:MAG: alpha/beta fold hydrolase [Bacteroidia bacterium]
MKAFLYSMLLLSTLLLACSKTDLSKLNETIYVRHNGADMPAYIHGNGSEKVFLLIVHGASSFGLAFRTPEFQSELESRYAVVYWDQRDQSMSQSNQIKELSVAERAEDIGALISVIKAKYGQDIKLFLFGHSWGGTLGMTYLLQAGAQEQLKGWIMANGAYDFTITLDERYQMLLRISEDALTNPNPGSSEQWNTLNTDLKKLDQASIQDDPDLLRPFVVETLSLLLKDGTTLPPDLGDLYRSAIIENNPLYWWLNDRRNKPYLEARDAGYALRERLAEITLPSLFLWGHFDLSVPPLLGEIAFAEQASIDKRLVILEQSEHLPYLSEPELFLEEVVAFVERLK